MDQVSKISIVIQASRL